MPTQHEWFKVTTGDARALEVLAAGPPDGLPFLFHNGTPTAATPWPLLFDTAAQRGLRTITYSRPGYAASSPHPGRSVADAVPDVVAILDQIGAGTFVTMGWSGGAPHALACAALLPDRCLAAVSGAGVAPYPSEGLDWLAGMGEDNVACCHALQDKVWVSGADTQWEVYTVLADAPEAGAGCGCADGDDEVCCGVRALPGELSA